MKPVQNRRIFERHRPSLQQRLENGAEFYYHSDCRETRIYPLLFQRSVREPLFTMILYELHALQEMHYRRRNADFFSLEVIWSGSLHVRQNERMFLLEPGDCFLIQPNSDAEELTGPDGFCIKTSIAVSGTLLLSALKSFGLDKTDVLTRLNWDELHLLLQQLKELSAITDRNTEQENGRLTYRLFQILQHPAEQSAPFQRIIGTAEWMEQHYDEPLNLEFLARRCGCSRNHLIRCFRKIHGVSPYQMLTAIRMREAARLLLTDRALSIKEIAARTGYAAPLNFSAEFRKRFGLSPREYRKARPDQLILTGKDLQSSSGTIPLEEHIFQGDGPSPETNR